MDEESLLDNLFDEENIEYPEDVDMEDVEEGELIEPISKTELEASNNNELDRVTQESNKRNPRRKKKKKKNKRKPGFDSGQNITDINRFVLEVCKRLRERKSYLMYTAVGCLGISALSDLVKEVDAIQACGGQVTADGKRFRNGGGVLWNIIKVRDPNAYKEIMAKGKEFEKQFKQQNEDKRKALPAQQRDTSLQNGSSNMTNRVKPNPSTDLKTLFDEQSQFEGSEFSEKRASVHERIRVPVTYGDLLEGESTNGA